jgi:hypothetical protein
MNRIQEDLSLALTEQIRTAIDERTREVADQVIKDISSRIFNSQESDEYYTEEELEKLRIKDGNWRNHCAINNGLFDGILKDYIIIGIYMRDHTTNTQKFVDINGNIHTIKIENTHYQNSRLIKIASKTNGYKFNKFTVDIISKINDIHHEGAFYNHFNGHQTHQQRVDCNLNSLLDQIVNSYAKFYPHKCVLTTMQDTNIANERILKKIRKETVELEVKKEQFYKQKDELTLQLEEAKKTIAKKEEEFIEREKQIRIRESLILDREIKVMENTLLYKKIDDVTQVLDGIKSVTIKVNTLVTNEIEGRSMSSNVKKHTMSAIKAELDEVVEQLYKQ